MKKPVLMFAIAGLMLSSATMATTYRATNWLQPIHTLNSEPYQKFAEELKKATDGDISFTVYSGGTLVPAKATIQALRDGTAQLGIVYPGYTPAELPLNNVLVDLGFLVKDPMAAAFAYTEINLANKDLINEWKKQGVIFAGGYSTPSYNFMCAGSIKSLADAKGKKIRTAGGTQTDWVSSIGGVPVSVPIGDVYTGLSRGSVDCTMAEVPNLINSKFIEVAKSITRLDMGTVPGAIYVMNQEFWKDLAPEDKKTMITYMAKGQADQQIAYAARATEALAMAEKEIQVIQPDQDLVDALHAFRTSYIKDLPAEAMEERGIADPSGLIAEYTKLEAKWHDLLGTIDRTDSDAVAGLLEKELYSRVDIDTFVIQ
ncbi:MAG: C4-dicarboxylate TRAP transporter substrate-binding protein [Alcaligenaceae bacterium]|nr:C4-dicarboxylate TRAP transporter substrate-binding protein [Alcaligenaceae bacterium]